MTAVEPHPDTLTDYHALKAIRRGSRQAIEDKAIESYHKAIDEGMSREEAEIEYFKHFNYKPCESKETSAVS
jgi:hypothetical protein